MSRPQPGSFVVLSPTEESKLTHLIMATLFDDVGKSGSDHLKNVFPSGKNNFETEVTAKAAGAKIVLVAKRNADGSIAGTFKPSYGFSAGDMKGEWKAQFGTDSTSKVDATFTFASFNGLKLKSGSNDTTFNAGADYVSENLASNLKFNYPFKGDRQSPSVEAAANYVHGCYSLGAKLVYPLDAAVPVLEGKAGVSCGKECSVLLSGKKTEKDTTFALGYFHQLSKTRTLASSVSFAPGTGATFLGGVGVVLSASNQVSDETLVKARFDTNRGALGFGLVQTLNTNVSVELGTDFPANFTGNSVYNLKFLYKA
nr:hypothetical protein [Paramoeba perurans]